MTFAPVPYARRHAADRRHALRPRARGAELLRLRDAYLEPFRSFTEPAALREAFDLAYRVGTIGRALAWHNYVREPDRQYLAEVAPAVPYGLQRFLEQGPIGTWRWE